MLIAFRRCLLVPLAGAAMMILVDCRPTSAADPFAIPGPSEPAPPTATVRIYRASCLKCHDSDGKGEIVRDVMPKVPDFTDAAWHAMRSDADLGRSILAGKGKSMPPMRDKLGTVDVGQMVAFVRAFRGGKQVVEDDEEPPTGSVPERSAAPIPTAGPGSPSAEPLRAGPEDVSFREGSRIFQRSCVACHGSDGRGAEMRASLPTIPDFSSHAWQGTRTEPQLVVSVLDGKGTGMPPFRDKTSREQARALVAFIRSMDPARPPATRPASDDFEARFRRLVAEFEDLRRQSRALSADVAPARDRSPGPSTSNPARQARRDESHSSGGSPGAGG